MRKAYSLIATSILACTALTAYSSDETIYTYADPSAETRAIGWGRYVDNDVAILLKNPAYVGYEVVGISVDIPVMEGCEVNPIGHAFLTSELLVDPDTYKNYADIGDPDGVPGEIINIGTEENPKYRLDITFPEPYVLSADGVYVGYTLKVTKLKSWTMKYPVEIASSPNPAGGLYMHMGYDFKSSTPPLPKNETWQDLAESNHAVSTMRVILRGQKLTHGASLTPQSVIFGENGKQQTMNAVLSNTGINPISTVDYTITISGGELTSDLTINNTLTLDTPLQPDETIGVTLPITFPDLSGDYSAVLTANLINGNENLFAVKSMPFSITTRAWIPRKRALIEDYTGLWCGYCPEAYVTIKQLEDQRADDFVALSFHRDDTLTTINSFDQPSPYSDLPNIQFDRNEYIENFPSASQMVDDCLNMLAPAEIDVKLYWNDEAKTSLRADADLKFVDSSSENPYKITFALVEDKVCDETLNQRNYFWNAASYTDSYYKMPYWDLFVGQGYEVSGIVYDEVVLIFNDVFGIPDSLPASIEADKTYTASHSFTLADAKCIYGSTAGQNVIRNVDNLRVVAILIDSKTGCAVNVNTSGYSGVAPLYGTSAVETLPADADSEVIFTEYYALNGMRLASRPASGAYIAVKHLSNGEIITAKYLQPLQ